MIHREIDENIEYVKEQCSIIHQKESSIHEDLGFLTNNISTYLNQINGAMYYLNLAQPRNEKELRFKAKELRHLFNLYETLANPYPARDQLLINFPKNSNTSDFCHAAKLTFQVLDKITFTLNAYTQKYDSQPLLDILRERIKLNREEHLQVLADINQIVDSQPMTSKKSNLGIEADWFSHLAGNKNLRMGSMIAFGLVCAIVAFRGSEFQLQIRFYIRKILLRLNENHGNSRKPISLNIEESFV